MKEIIIALISGSCVGIPSVLATILTNSRNKALINYKIEELTKQVNAHNNLIDRMYRVEARVTLLEEEHKKDD